MSEHISLIADLEAGKHCSLEAAVVIKQLESQLATEKAAREKAEHVAACNQTEIDLQKQRAEAAEADLCITKEVYAAEVNDFDRVLAKIGISAEEARTEGGILRVARVCVHLQETYDALRLSQEFGADMVSKYSNVCAKLEAAEQQLIQESANHGATQMKMRNVEAALKSAEQRISDSQEQAPHTFCNEVEVGGKWLNDYVSAKEKSENPDNKLHQSCTTKLYKQPIIPPEVEELQRELAGKEEVIAEFNRKLKDVTKERDDALRENAELTKLLSERSVPEWKVPYWSQIEEAPSTCIVTNNKGQVAPMVRGIIQNNVGTEWDWDFGSEITGYMPMPQPKEQTFKYTEQTSDQLWKPKEPT